MGKDNGNLVTQLQIKHYIEHGWDLNAIITPSFLKSLPNLRKERRIIRELKDFLFGKFRENSTHIVDKFHIETRGLSIYNRGIWQVHAHTLYFTWYVELGFLKFKLKQNRCTKKHLSKETCELKSRIRTK